MCSSTRPDRRRAEAMSRLARESERPRGAARSHAQDRGSNATIPRKRGPSMASTASTAPAWTSPSTPANWAMPSTRRSPKPRPKMSTEAEYRRPSRARARRAILSNRHYASSVALFIPGKTTCSICGHVLATNDRILAFPPFLGPDHDLWPHSDAVMHAECYEAWPERDRFQRLLEHPEERPPALDEAAHKLIEARIPGAYVRRSRIPTDEENRHHNDEHERIMAIVRAHGGTCPHCKGRAARYRELEETSRKRLVCYACA